MATQLGDGDLQRLAGGFRGAVAPELVDEPVGGDGLVAVEQQNREQRSLLGGAELDGAVFADHLKRAKDSELHYLDTPAPIYRGEPVLLGT